MVRIGAELQKLSPKIKLCIRFWTTLYIIISKTCSRHIFSRVLKFTD